VDVLVLYDVFTPTAAVTAKVAALRAEGKTVSAQRAIPDKLRYGTILDMRKEASV
jgi:ATP phosphoribosyltransferase regulatory subunit